jgi:hypothetical protein
MHRMLFLQFIVLPHNYLLRNCYLQQLLNKETRKELLFTDVKFNEYLFPKLSDITDKAVVSVPQSTRPSQSSLPALLTPTTSSLPNTRPAGQRTRPRNTELRDTQLHAADEREALPFTTSSYSGRLSSTVSGSGATRPGMATYRPAKDTIFKPTRLGRVPKRTIFSDSVM